MGKHSYRLFFLYCKICPKVEFQSLISMENHIRLKDPEHHKAKLFEMIKGVEYMDKYESKNEQDTSIIT